MVTYSDVLVKSDSPSFRCLAVLDQNVRFAHDGRINRLAGAVRKGTSMPDVSADTTYISPGRAADILRVSPKTVNRWADDGRIPCAVTLGGHRRFQLEVIRAVARSMGVDDHAEGST